MNELFSPAALALQVLLEKILNLIIPPMCILLKLDYEQLGVSSFFSQSYRRKTFGGGSTPLVKERLRAGINCVHSDNL